MEEDPFNSFDRTMASQLLVNRYQIHELLGKNAGRRTFLAEDGQTQERVVVKLLRFDGDFQWDDLKLFEREAETLKALSHPAIPQYLNYFELNQPDYKGFGLVQTYIDARSLKQLVEAGRRFTETELRQIAHSLLHVLIYLHDRHPPVIHRDIKPSNILLGDYSGNWVGQLYLVDFGSVQTLAAQEGHTITVVGTYGYMPPEQFGGRTTPVSDLYGLGATLIFLATGQEPADLPQEALQIQFEAAANLSPGFTRWLRRMVEPSLDRRFRSAREALEALSQPELGQAAAPLAIAQPAGSRIVLKKDRERLEIVIPPEGFNLGVGGKLIFAVPWNAFLIFWYSMALKMWSAWGWFMAIFAIGHLSVGVGLVASILFSLFGRIRLRIDGSRVVRTIEIFGVTLPRPKPAPTQNINKLEYTPRSTKRDSDGDQVPVSPKITLWAGAQKFELDCNYSMSDPEMEWLAQELSDWLNLPICERK